MVIETRRRNKTHLRAENENEELSHMYCEELDRDSGNSLDL